MMSEELAAEMRWEAGCLCGRQERGCPTKGAPAGIITGRVLRGCWDDPHCVELSRCHMGFRLREAGVAPARPRASPEGLGSGMAATSVSGTDPLAAGHEAIRNAAWDEARARFEEAAKSSDTPESWEGLSRAA